MIAGDANLCEVATFLKVGTTAIVLAMIEDGFIEKDLSIIGPVAAMRTVSHDPTCRATVELLDGGRITAVELQWEFLRLAQKYADETGLDACGGDEVGGMVLAAGSPCSPTSSATRWCSTASSTGSPSCRCCRPTRTATASTGPTPSSRCSTSSTTTSGPTGRSTRGSCGRARSSGS